MRERISSDGVNWRVHGVASINKTRVSRSRKSGSDPHKPPSHFLLPPRCLIIDFQLFGSRKSTPYCYLLPSSHPSLRCHPQTPKSPTLRPPPTAATNISLPSSPKNPSTSPTMPPTTPPVRTTTLSTNAYAKRPNPTPSPKPNGTPAVKNSAPPPQNIARAPVRIAAA